ncbi:2Fe-2S iron-sulfur cluster-binding protein [uncultured Tateyamaria sp.]|uniref:2Fe-2S iron-sulfur cluster-binding protein n=1 Tax=uncultured Tateyamaria sp. TaxID=455651 RepID=UPI002607350A|nr:2Fe-2S iron-sulfur cluster-binding protein [uncultured Tateyamaria sp.]
MVKLTFVQADGTEHQVDATLGLSVMQVALSQGVPGISAECNGSAACATCHVYFDASVFDLLPAVQTHEDDMLDFAASDRKPGSRLSCQVQVTEALAGTRIQLPDLQ